MRELFGSRYITRLERDLLDTEKERDYFRGKCERLELMLLPNRNPIKQQESRVPAMPHKPRTTAEAYAVHMKNEFAEEEKAQ
jgi:hypothetical protein